MNNIRTSFSISDLENFTGIKAHTIRAWERRYGLFNPDRTEGNQRFYDLNNLQKLLNVKLLYDHGHKISEIAAMPSHQLPHNVLKATSTKLTFDQAIDAFKLSMLQFDPSMFEATYQSLCELMGFRDIFLKVFIPLLDQVGLLWQVDSITPANEHFISSLILQKVHSNIERVSQQLDNTDERVYVLFLPMHEIHDLGLHFLHYELLSSGKRSIYLGQSIPVESLISLKTRFDKMTYVSYFTVEPTADKIEAYLNRMEAEILNRAEDHFWILGMQTTHIDDSNLSDCTHKFTGLNDLLDSIKWRSLHA